MDQPGPINILLFQDLAQNEVEGLIKLLRFTALYSSLFEIGLFALRPLAQINAPDN
jgi:hypothetical protein